jgi:hypothetical protein
MDIEPALVPVFPAFLRPFFLIMKLDPIKMLDETAKTSPWALSDDIPIDQKRCRGKNKFCRAKRSNPSSYIHQIKSEKANHKRNPKNPKTNTYILYIAAYISLV